MLGLYPNGAVPNGYGAAAQQTINLTAASSTQANTSGTGAATVTPAAAGVVNLIGSSCSQANTSGVGAVTVTPAPKTVNLVGSSCTQGAVSGTGAASVTPQGTQPSSVTVPAARTAKFAGRSRVVAFTTSKPVSYAKGPLDELYIVGDFTKDLFEASTTISSVAPISAGVAVLEGPVLQNGFPVVKLGALDLSAPKMYFTFRATLANGEQIDRTVELTALDDRKTFPKDPDDKRFYALDFSADAIFGGTALATVSAPVPVGVTSLMTPSLQGNIATVKVGGLDTADGAANSIGLWANFANTERIFRAIYFTQEEH